jgi:threonine dehydrogenase-like Zn-dependent dehydrogenase
MIPKTMKAVVVTAPETVEVREMTTPVAEAGEILVRLTHCLICTWEQRVFAGTDVALPFVPGHEVAGTIAHIPDGTYTDLEAGQPCVVKTFDSCGRCEFCRLGRDNLCKAPSKKRFYDGIPGAGGMAQYIAIGADRVFALPNRGVDLSLAAFAEPLACCLHSMEQAGISYGEDVVIVGGGIMGQLHAVLTRLSGARAIVVEPDEKRRKLALDTGSHAVIDPVECDVFERIRELTGGRGAHAVIFTVNNLKLAGQYIDALADAGRLVYYGSFRPKDDIPFNPNHIHYSEKVLTGAYSPTVRAFWQAAQMIGNGLIDLSPYLSERYSLAEVKQAFLRAGSMETLRVLIDLGD